MTNEGETPAAIECLDQEWEWLLGNSSSPADDSGHTLTDAIRWFHSLDNAPAPDSSFVQRLENDLMSNMAPLEPVTGNTPLPPTTWDSTTPGTPTRQPARWKRRNRAAASLELLAAAILLFAIGLTAFNAWQLAAPPAATPTTIAPSSIRLGISDAVGTQLTALDPMTLEDSPDRNGPLAALPSPVAGLEEREQPPSYLASRDGSTVVRVEYPVERANTPLQFTVTVLDGRSGDVRRQFTQAAQASGLYTIPLLSADGTRLLIPNQPSDTAQAKDYYGWWVFDTTTGQRVSTVLVKDSPPAVLSLFAGRFFVDPHGTRLYRFVGVVRTAPEPPSNVSPIILELVVHDLSTGDVIKTLKLPYIWTAFNDESGTATDPLAAMALSPDGRELALVHPDGATVTLIDTARLAVSHTIKLHDAPNTAEGTPGTALTDRKTPFLHAPILSNAAFSPDGQRLTVIWAFNLPDVPYDQWLRIQTIDLATGELVIDQALPAIAWPFPAAVIDEHSFLRLSDDGKSLYIYGPSLNTPQSTRFAGNTGQASLAQRDWILLRLSADTLVIEAQRTFTGYRSVLTWGSS